MLTFCDRSALGRREFLRIGSLALSGLSLSSLLAGRAAMAQGALTPSGRGVVRDKSVVFLFMHGGPSQIETFDPKPEAPVEVRSATGDIGTKLAGVRFGGTYEKLAALADKISVVRSFTTGDGNHDIKPIVGVNTLKANMGSLYARVAGINHPVTGIPTNAAIFPKSVNPEAGAAQEGFGKFWDAGPLGAAYAPFVPGAGGNLQSDMKLTLDKSRLDDRRALLARLDAIRRTVECDSLEGQGLDKFTEQAFATVLSGVGDAFDLSKEDPKTIARYDTSQLVRPDQISRKWNNYKFYVDHGKTLGKLMLLARRLCEAGCGFVTVTTNFVWDNHSDVNNAGVEEGQRYCGLPFDHAVSTFIQDVHERGLSDKILLVCCGEMGRTPRINKTGGRDHWGGLAPLLLSGGGLEMGKVIGQSTRDGGQPQSEPVTIKHLTSTIMHTLFDVGALRILRDVPTDVARVITDGEPIPGLLA
ncbi:MAG: DUF1501 domain-containing protein [Planctomycetia bacterium]|nr:DUF1501 domain-containing protein [Planctomycetia bacterium]